LIFVRGLPDDVGFATSIITALESAGITAEYASGVGADVLSHREIESANVAFGSELASS